MPEEYTIKEVMENRFSELLEHVKEIKQDGKETKAKVEFQNGRVRKVEDWTVEAGGVIKNIASDVEDLEKGRNKLMGFFLAFTLVGATVATLSIMVINNEIDDKIDEGIRQALSAYNIEVR